LKKTISNASKTSMAVKPKSKPNKPERPDKQKKREKLK